MKKKPPVITLAEREEAARIEGLSGEVTLALADVAVTMRDGLMAMSSSAGLLVVAEIRQAEIASLWPVRRAVTIPSAQSLETARLRDQ